MFMLLLTVLFILYYLTNIVKGNIFYNFAQETAKLQLEFAEKERKWEYKYFPEDFKVKGTLFTIGMFLFLFIELLYVLKGVSIDPYRYPSIIALLYPIIALAFTKFNTKKDDLTTEEGREKFKIKYYKMKKRTLKGTLLNLLWLEYFSYMFWVLVF